MLAAQGYGHYCKLNAGSSCAGERCAIIAPWHGMQGWWSPLDDSVTAKHHCNTHATLLCADTALASLLHFRRIFKNKLFQLPSYTCHTAWLAVTDCWASRAGNWQLSWWCWPNTCCAVTLVQHDIMQCDLSSNLHHEPGNWSCPADGRQSPTMMVGIRPTGRLKHWHCCWM